MTPFYGRECLRASKATNGDHSPIGRWTGQEEDLIHETAARIFDDHWGTIILENYLVYYWV